MEMDKQALASALDQICDEKGISKEQVIGAVEAAIEAAYKKDYGKKSQIIKAKFDINTGNTDIFRVKEVVETKKQMVKNEETGEETEELFVVEIEPKLDEEGNIIERRFNEERHLELAEAQKTKEDTKIGDLIEFPAEEGGAYGRIAAQTAKQVIIQRIREAEKQSVYDEFKNKEGMVINGIVQRIEKDNVFIDIGKTVGILFPGEQVYLDRYRSGQRLKVLILKVEKDIRGAGVILSRANADFVKRLFEVEVPEIAAGSVLIKEVAREAGSRTKIAVASKEEGIDPIGSCVGQKGTRVQAIINELNGEKIDIIEWNESSKSFIEHALAPAKVANITLNKEEKVARVEVAADQLSLAIGKNGQNVRLAAKLTGWKIDILEEGKGKESKDEVLKQVQDDSEKAVEKKEEKVENK